MVAFIIAVAVLSDDANVIGFVVEVDELGRGTGGISSAHHETVEVEGLSFGSTIRACVRSVRCTSRATMLVIESAP